MSIPDLSQLLLVALHTDAKAGSSRMQSAKDRRAAPYKKNMQKQNPPTSAVSDMAMVLAKGGRFTVHVPRPGKKDWSANFTVETETTTTIRMYRKGDPGYVRALEDGEDDDDQDDVEELEYCTGLKLDHGSYHPSLYVETLFEVSDRVIGSCDMDPTDAPGVGSLTLQVFDLVAMAMGIKSLTLSDMAMYRAEGPRPPITLDSSLSSTLTLLRGYGYYEARGYFSDDFVVYGSTIPFEIELANIETIDLRWSHMIATTPIGSLVAAVAAFPNVMNSLDFEVPKYCREKYTREWCTEHAQRVRVKTVQPIVDWITATYGDAVASSYMNYSIRKLTNIMATVTNPLIRSSFGSALVLPIHIAMEDEKVNMTKHKMTVRLQRACCLVRCAFNLDYFLKHTPTRQHTQSTPTDLFR